MHNTIFNLRCQEPICTLCVKQICCNKFFTKENFFRFFDLMFVSIDFPAHCHQLSIYTLLIIKYIDQLWIHHVHYNELSTNVSALSNLYQQKFSNNNFTVCVSSNISNVKALSSLKMYRFDVLTFTIDPLNCLYDKYYSKRTRNDHIKHNIKYSKTASNHKHHIYHNAHFWNCFLC